MQTHTNPTQPTLVQFGTSKLRHTILKSPQFHGNYAPFLPPEMLITNPNLKGCSHFFKLSNTTRAIEAKDLQYRVLRNTCIINNKLFHMKILDTPKCTLCNHPTQNSPHRFYHCPQARETWQLLTHITSQTHTDEHRLTHTQTHKHT